MKSDEPPNPPLRLGVGPHDQRMKARSRKILGNGVSFALLFTILASLAGSCGPPREVTSGPRCGFADPEVTTHMGICNLAAE